MARVFVEFLRMDVELSAALKIFENFLFRFISHVRGVVLTAPLAPP